MNRFLTFIKLLHKNKKHRNITVFFIVTRPISRVLSCTAIYLGFKSP